METPMLDLAPITRHLRAKAGSHLLVAAIHHLGVFELLAKEPLSLQELQQALSLKERPAMVLFPALCAMGMLKFNEEGKFRLTDLGTYLTAACPANLIGYAGLEKQDGGVLQMVQWLKDDGPEDATHGLSYVKDEQAPSPMDDPEAARFFTLALAGRARYLSPLVAAALPKNKTHLLDVACGTGYYSYEWLAANPAGSATLFDRPEVLKVAAELLEEFCNNKGIAVSSFKNRITFLPGDMLTEDLPQADLLLAASLFHDWPTDICEMLMQKFAAALKPGGALWVHDAFLNDALDGPLAVTDYSAMLFLGTKGRAYSKKEYRSWMVQSGLVPSKGYVPTLMDYGLIAAHKPV